ncbi:hypothetical protein K2173_018639 [Erythroxylum novogranatense]|uniref:Uncharacterized protein n=1 Tax=Erythroxylum novogranatense TaxID=1862640 RepID=A0AAV8SAU9_9ROSI|nr:hypothetical protein K2173_018639 [Erythroxylum novogranatense]
MHNPNHNIALIDSFCEITSSTRDEALFFLESHQWDVDAAVSTFLDNNAAAATATATATSGPHQIPPIPLSPTPSRSPSESHSPNFSPSHSSSPSRSRSRSPSPTPPSRVPYKLRSRQSKSAGAGSSRTRGGIRTLSDLNRAPEATGSSSDEDEAQGYYTGGDKSGILVQDPTKRYDVDGFFDQARLSGAVDRSPDNIRPSSSSSRSFTGTGRLLSGETVSAAPQAVNHTIVLWRNGFTVDNGHLRRFDEPANATFLESILKSECPQELRPADRRTEVHLNLMRREEDYSEPEKPRDPFQGVGRALGNSSSSSAPLDTSLPSDSLMTAPLPATGLVVDSSSPTTSIQLRLADGTRMVSRFNLNHTIRDLRSFIDASRPVGARDYQLQTMGFPPKPLTDLDQTIEEVGIANSVVIQKY